MSNTDKTTFHPFIVIDGRDSEWSDVRVSFDNWGWLQEAYKTDIINDYHMNGYGIQALVLAARVAAGLDVYPADLDLNSEGDTCYLIFKNYASAVETAGLAKEMITSRKAIEKMINIAREHNLED
ncbi:hypothetical protein MO867_22110 [Microbulbifer sp. OS29]|uniref:Phage ABA sandwich domain-containing protein n=1 Tax=Microbulbifer okhotskensis TaxID=2926617 RepID=A0A9X2ERH5_9GAMM|nr:hypothetical protein [Microbulbifer okhotskensis]MCO1337022.1 hypothetical protein [Microbulbifer okhotskensis]